MDDYTIVFARSARKELEDIDEPLVSRIFDRITSLASEPRPRNCSKLKGSRNLWRIRIEDYRVVYSIEDRARVIDIIAVKHRSEAYR